MRGHHHESFPRRALQRRSELLVATGCAPGHGTRSIGKLLESEHVLRHYCRHGRHGTAHTGLCLLRTADLSEASDPNIWVDGSRCAVGIHSRKDTCMRDAPRMNFGARMFCTVASMERSPLRLRYSMRRSTFAAPSRLIYPHAWAILAYQT